MAQCKKLAKRKGLSGTFVVANEKVRPQGHLDMMEQWAEMPRIPRYVVYDVEAYSYEAILGIFSSKPVDYVNIGTYHPRIRTIITAEEVLK